MHVWQNLGYGGIHLIAWPYHEKHVITLVSSIDQFTDDARSRILEQNEIVREKKRHPKMPFLFRYKQLSLR